jgi:hypothetical protein
VIDDIDVSPSSESSSIFISLFGSTSKLEKEKKNHDMINRKSKIISYASLVWSGDMFDVFS